MDISSSHNSAKDSNKNRKTNLNVARSNLSSSLSSPSLFLDASTECAICLAPLLVDGGDDESQQQQQEIIELKCGHRWHLQCIKEQLQHGRPQYSRRIVFTGCRCAKCGMFCDHELLQDLTQEMDILRNKVDKLIEEQYSIDTPEVWQSTINKYRLIEEGRRMYAFYLCSCCNEPYFGGTIECADQEEGEIPPNERFCPSCSPQTSTNHTHCQNQIQHRPYHIWKCRYCCTPSNFVCYGTVHFCKECHDRNTKRYNENNINGIRSRKTSRIPPLSAIPCPGGMNCSYPKPPNEQQHKNGSSSSCEQVYFCAICSTKSDMNNSVQEQLPSSSNLMINASGRQGLQGWIQLGHRISWKVERPDIPVNDTIDTCFVSSFEWCCMKQIIPIHRYIRASNHNQSYDGIKIEISVLYKGRWDCPSIFVLEGQILNERSQSIQKKRTDVLNAPVDYWERVSLLLELTPDTHSTAIIVYGKDTRYWNGDYGSKVTDCSVRIIAETTDQLESILIGNRVAGGGEQMINNDQRNRQNNYEQNRKKWHEDLLWDVVVPIIFLFLIWLHQKD